MNRRFFIKALVGIGASVGLRQVIPDAWAFENGTYNGPSLLRKCTAFSERHGGDNSLIKIESLFMEELHKYPKHSWAHSINRTSAGIHSRLWETVISGVSRHPRYADKAKGFMFAVNEKMFIEDPAFRARVTKQAIESLTIQWKRSL